MAKLNKVNRKQGVRYDGKLMSPKLVKKKIARITREMKKKMVRIPFGGVLVDKKAEKNLMYLYSNGLIDG